MISSLSIFREQLSSHLSLTFLAFLLRKHLIEISISSDESPGVDLGTCETLDDDFKEPCTVGYL